MTEPNITKKIKILAIDDERDILYALQAIGQQMGWNVLCETNSLIALNKMETAKPDIILLDYHMPQQDGITILKKIRKKSRTVPVIVLTVDERQEIADQFMDAGASDFANKPIKVADLAARIRLHIQLLQKQFELRENAIVCKGINEATLKLIHDYCAAQADWFYIEDVVENVGLAYQTTVRYLQYLITEKHLTMVSDYGKVGRPRNKYKYI